MRDKILAKSKQKERTLTAERQTSLATASLLLCTVHMQAGVTEMMWLRALTLALILSAVTGYKVSMPMQKILNFCKC